jgi:formate dehydrogenase iron-sulfur subunit
VGSPAPTELAVVRPEAEPMGFFTDTTVCIGCKACEVACKQWNDLPADQTPFERGSSYDHTHELSGSTWRHVRFVEQLEPSPEVRKEARRALERGAGGGSPSLPANGEDPGGGTARPTGAGDLDLVAAAREGDGMTGLGQEGAGAGASEAGGWIFMSDVCKHCSNAGCLDACPTGAIIRTEFATVVVQEDVCNGCGYCIAGCPFGVIDRDQEDGRAAKCTLCYDRLGDGLEPACAKACPTDSIQFGPYDELVDVAKRRVRELQRRGVDGAYLYGAGDEPGEQLAGGLQAFFLLTAQPETYGLPAQAESPIQENVVAATAAAMSAGLLAAAGVAVAFVTSRGAGSRRARLLALARRGRA